MIFVDAWPFIDGRAIVWVKDTVFADDYPCTKEKCGLINTSGEFLVPPIYDDMRYVGGTNIAVNIGFEEHDTYQESGKWGMIDMENHILIPLKYSDLHICKESPLYLVEYGSLWGIINVFEEIVIPLKYESLSWPDKYGWIVAKREGKYGCITMKEEIMMPFIYDDIMLYGAETLIPVKYGEQAFYTDRNSRQRVLL